MIMMKYQFTSLSVYSYAASNQPAECLRTYKNVRNDDINGVNRELVGPFSIKMQVNRLCFVCCYTYILIL